MKDDTAQRIYKYRSLGGDFGHQAIENSILYDRLWWQSPLEFNDPFDCDPVFFFGENDKQRREFLKRGPGSTLVGTRAERMQQVNELRKKPHKYMAKVLQEEWPKWMADTAVTCFSGKNDDLLMWAHYADSHRGVCLIFDDSIEDDFFALSVNYKEYRPRANICTMRPIDIMEITMLTKSVHWQYEDEYRIIGYRRKRGYNEYPSKCLSGIVLGARINEDDAKFVINLANKRQSLEIYQASIDKEKFKINIDRV